MSDVVFLYKADKQLASKYIVTEYRTYNEAYAQIPQDEVKDTIFQDGMHTFLMRDGTVMDIEF